MNRQSYIYGTLISLTVVLWFFLIYSPYLQNKDHFVNEIQNANIKLADFEQTINKLPDYIARRESLKKRREYLNSNLYTKEEVLNLFNQLKDKAARHNLYVSEITPPVEELLYLNSIVPDTNRPQFLNIGVHVTGSYIDFGKFVKTIEDQAYFRGINNCRISGSRDYNSQLDMYVTFKALLGRIGDKS